MSIPRQRTGSGSGHIGGAGGHLRNRGAYGGGRPPKSGGGGNKKGCAIIAVGFIGSILAGISALGYEVDRLLG